MITFTNSDLARFTEATMQEYSLILAEKVHKKRSQRKAVRTNIAMLKPKRHATTNSVYLRMNQAV